ncbi:hypothetical protein HDU97_010409 [Phlyctochytrium planicorne]|nr:hypothetical protein HDU97_010409 [Phlyctochytrium planicorne]
MEGLTKYGHHIRKIRWAGPMGGQVLKFTEEDLERYALLGLSLTKLEAIDIVSGHCGDYTRIECIAMMISSIPFPDRIRKVIVDCNYSTWRDDIDFEAGVVVPNAILEAISMFQNATKLAVGYIDFVQAMFIPDWTGLIQLHLMTTVSGDGGSLPAMPTLTNLEDVMLVGFNPESVHNFLAQAAETSNLKRIKVILDLDDEGRHFKTAWNFDQDLNIVKLLRRLIRAIFPAAKVSVEASCRWTWRFTRQFKSFDYRKIWKRKGRLQSRIGEGWRDESVSGDEFEAEDYGYDYYDENENGDIIEVEDEDEDEDGDEDGDGDGPGDGDDDGDGPVGVGAGNKEQ